MNKKLCIALILISYALLYPGLTLPLLNLSADVEKADLAEIGKNIIVEDPQTPEFIGNMAQALVDSMQINGSIEAYNKTRSIVGTIRELFESGHGLVAFLVGLFSIIIPVAKGMLMLIGSLQTNPSLGQKIRSVNSVIAKWSMADVFVIGVFVAFLAANAVQDETGLIKFDAMLGAGFYCFLGYCFLSILASQIWNHLHRSFE